MKWLPVLVASLLNAAGNPSGQVDYLFSKWNSTNTPGCAVGVLQDGKAVHQKAYGMANLEHGVANTAQTAFYLGSTSKEFTALSILLLAEAGRLKLDDPVRRWLPDLPDFMQPVTVRHLLEHTSGVRDYIGLWTLSAPAEDAPLTDAQVYSLIAGQKALNFSPGDEFLYSNSNYYLLNRVLRPSGFRQLQDFARENIFTPLGLRNTLYYTDRFQLLARRATGYSPLQNGSYRINTATLDVIGDGGVFTTLEDGLKWLQTLDSPQGVFAKILPQMMMRGKLNSGALTEYGRGFMLKRHRGIEIVSHVGGLRGYRSEFLWIPSRRLGVVCLCNTSDADAGRMARAVADAYLGPVQEPPLPRVTAADVERKTGVYRDRMSGDVLQLVFTQGRFVALYQGFQLDLRPDTAMRFHADGPLYLEIEFQRAGTRDEPRFLRVESESHRPANFEHITLNGQRPSNVQQYEGDYACEEAQARLTVRLVEGALTLEQNEQNIGTLEQTQTDRFRSVTINVEFMRDSTGKVNGFRMNTGRVRGLVFTKH